MHPLQRSMWGAATLLGFTFAIAGVVRSQAAALRVPAAAQPTPPPATVRSGGGESPVPGRARVPLYFTAPADAPRAAGPASPASAERVVRRYEFLQMDASGVSDTLRAYADSVGGAGLVPHPPGTREIAWLELAPGGLDRAVVVLSHGWSGHPSQRSNPVTIAAIVRAGTPQASTSSARTPRTTGPVPGAQAMTSGRLPR